MLTHHTVETIGDCQCFILHLWALCSGRKLRSRSFSKRCAWELKQCYNYYQTYDRSFRRFSQELSSYISFLWMMISSGSFMFLLIWSCEIDDSRQKYLHRSDVHDLSLLHAHETCWKRLQIFQLSWGNVHIVCSVLVEQAVCECVNRPEKWLQSKIRCLTLHGLQQMNDRGQCTVLQ